MYSRPNTEALDRNEYEWSGRFRFVSNTLGFTRRFMDGMTDVIFNTHNPDQLGKEYFTYAGPSFAHSGAFNRNDAIGLQGAIRRLTSVRCPGEFVDCPVNGRISYHQWLINNQFANLNIIKMGERIEKRRAAVHFVYQQINEDAVTLRNKWCEKPHAKLRLRLRTRWYMHRDMIVDNIHVKHNTITYKVKTGEILPAFKYLRGIGDLRNPACTRLGYLFDYIKKGYEQPIYTNNCQLRFVKSPDKDELTTVFNDIIRPTRDGYMYYFSDDAILSCVCSDGVLMADSDLSKSDGSQFTPVFKSCAMVIKGDARFDDDIDVGLRQCQCKIRVTNPEDSRERYVLEPSSVHPDDEMYYLPSGSGFTTTINNEANETVGYNFFSNYYDKTKTRAENAQLYMQAAEEMGYIVKIKIHECVEKLSFLKHFPALCGDSYVPILCPGVMLRAAGKTWGDYPGKKSYSIVERAQAFNYQYALSLVHAGDHCITDSFRKAFKPCDVKGDPKMYQKMIKQYTVYSSNSSIHRIGDESLCRRYSIGKGELDELCHLITHSRVGEVISCVASRKMLDMDYEI